jgi:uncharacterized membrane protein YhaH (DUF805 family)
MDPVEASPFGDAPVPRSPFRFRWDDLPALWFGTSLPVSRGAYAATGFGLMLFKYAAEAAVIWQFTGLPFSPLDFLNPLISARTQILETAPQWVAWAMFLWTFPFLWISFSMSIRRAADAGASPWLGLLVLVPGANLLFMIIMCLLPTSQHGTWGQARGNVETLHQFRSAALGVGISVLFAVGMVGVAVYGFATYGTSLFFATPTVMGAVSAYLYNRPYRRGMGSTFLVSTMAVTLAGLVLLLFALEGVICLLMAVPLVYPLGWIGCFIGKAIADFTTRPRAEVFASALLLPLVALGESRLATGPEYVVRTTIEIDAPPETVWNHVVDFPDLPPPEEWYFRAGIACPQRARIDGTGVGAVRYCIFTTGQFVEPITVWEPGRRLAFDVTDQPAPMFELSPYRHVHPPHLHGYLRSNRGEFLLVPLPGGRTRLEGRTWYQFDMFPQGYWTLWSDLVIGRIHERVLQHVKGLAEADG